MTGPPVVDEGRPGSLWRISMTEKFRELCDHVAKLNAMLADPQFGLSSWCKEYAGHMKFISDYWTQN